MNTTPFEFRIRKTTREAWDIVIKHVWFFVGVGIISVLLSVLGGENAPLLLNIILGIASLIWSLITIRIGLAAARGEHQQLNFKAVQGYMPTLRDVLVVIGIGLLTGLFVLCGLILLIIPGIYVAIRLSFATLAYFDRKQGVRASIRYSWDITKGRVWVITLTALFALLINLLGLIALVVGLLIAACVARVLIAKLYLALSRHYDGATVVAEPIEVPADLPQAETV